jgi:hypothetical protein
MSMNKGRATCSWRDEGGSFEMGPTKGNIPDRFFFSRRDDADLPF